MSTVVDIQDAADPRDIIHQAVRLLAEGDLVAFPTETVYVICAYGLKGEAVSKMCETLNADSQPRYSLAIKSAQEALDYVPHMPNLGRRLARRCWPGPVTIEFDISPDDGLMKSLPAETREAVVPKGEIRLRVPAHRVVNAVSRLLPAPLVMSSESISDAPAATAAAEVQERFGEDVMLIIDDGACRYGEPATVIHVSDESWKLVESGVVTETTVGRLASEIYLFVCTGNTCRSPMAEAIFRKLLREKLQCSEEELVDRGFVGVSAGLAAAIGASASPESVEILKKQGIDLRGHESQPLTNRLLDQADHIYNMTRGHRDAILADRPELSERVKLLSPGGADVSDPIGGGIREYMQCAKEIERHIRTIVDQIPSKSGLDSI